VLQVLGAQLQAVVVYQAVVVALQADVKTELEKQK
jgi:hypothetical protein